MPGRKSRSSALPPAALFVMVAIQASKYAAVSYTHLDVYKRQGPKKCCLADSTLSGFKSPHERFESSLGKGGPGMALDDSA